MRTSLLSSKTASSVTVKRIDSDDSEEDDDGNEDVSEELQEEMATMSVTAKATIKLPMLTYTWSRNRQEYCSVDILLLSGTTQDQIECKLHKSGRHMTVFYKLPEFFVTSRRLEASSGGVIDQNHAKTSAFNKAIDEFRETFDFEEPTLEFKFKLPFKVENKFFREVAWYKHDNTELRKEAQFYYMLHIELLGAEKPRQLKSPIARRIVDSPEGDQEGQFDYEVLSGTNLFE